MEAFFRNPFQNGTPPAEANYEKWRDSSATSATAAAPASSAAASAALVPGQDCMMLTISTSIFFPANGVAGLAAKSLWALTT